VTRDLFPAEAARVAAGLTDREAAKLLHVRPERLRRMEREGDFCHGQAQRLAHFYQCRIEVFLPVKREKR
jgi:hypothetical protein